MCGGGLLLKTYDKLENAYSLKICRDGKTVDNIFECEKVHSFLSVDPDTILRINLDLHHFVLMDTNGKKGNIVSLYPACQRVFRAGRKLTNDPMFKRYAYLDGYLVASREDGFIYVFKRKDLCLHFVGRVYRFYLVSDLHMVKEKGKYVVYLAKCLLLERMELDVPALQAN